MIGQKENLLRMLDGQMPEYVPINSFFVNNGKPPLMAGGMMFNPSILGDFRGPNGGYDPWGVHYTTESSAGVVAVSLTASAETLRQRLSADVAAGKRQEDIIARSTERIPLYDALNTVKLSTDGKTPSRLAGELVAL